MKKLPYTLTVNFMKCKIFLNRKNTLKPIEFPLLGDVR